MDQVLFMQLSGAQNVLNMCRFSQKNVLPAIRGWVLSNHTDLPNEKQIGYLIWLRSLR